MAPALQQGIWELKPFGTEPSIWKRNWKEGTQEGSAELGAQQKLPHLCHCHPARGTQQHSVCRPPVAGPFLLLSKCSQPALSPFHPAIPRAFPQLTPPLPRGCLQLLYLLSAQVTPPLFLLAPACPQFYQPAYPVKPGSFLMHLFSQPKSPKHLLFARPQPDWHLLKGNERECVSPRMWT